MSKISIALWIGAFAMSCICLAPLHFYSTFGFWIFVMGFPGGFAMLLVDGVHGDFNFLGGMVYVTVNTIFFYYLLKLVRYLFKRYRES